MTDEIPAAVARDVTETGPLEWVPEKPSIGYVIANVAASVAVIAIAAMVLAYGWWGR